MLISKIVIVLIYARYPNELSISVSLSRDVRRLVVALSRARLGLYVFARVSLFQNCFELTPAFNQLMVRPLRLHLLPYEAYPPVRKVSIVKLELYENIRF